MERLDACIYLFLQQSCQPACAMLRLLGHMDSVVVLTCLGLLHTHPLQFCLLNQWQPHCYSLEAHILRDQVFLMVPPWWVPQNNSRSGIDLQSPEPTDDRCIVGRVGHESFCHWRPSASVQRVAPLLCGSVHQLTPIGSSLPVTSTKLFC